MRHKPFMLLLLCVFLCLLSGCWDREELQQLSIVSGMAIDKGGDAIKNRYKVTVQIINPSQVSGGQQGGKVQASPVTTFTETGRPFERFQQSHRESFSFLIFKFW
jgi:spore germination protein KC